MINPVSFGPLTRTAIFIQEHDLVSRGVIDALGTATPIIGLARTHQERREKIIDRIVVIGSLFVLAPMHAWALMHGVSKLHKIPAQLMGISFSKLSNPALLKTSLQQLKPTPQLKKFIQRTSPKALEQLRQKIIRAKVDMFVPDLMLECFIMGGVGWITNLFSRKLTGRNRFSGEPKATSESNLNRLYEKEKGYQNSEKYRMIATLAISFGVPMIMGWMLKKAMLPRIPKASWAKRFRKIAPWFDYHKGYWMSAATLWTVCNVQLSGHLLAARNFRELRENFIRENMLTLICMEGLKVWMSFLKKAVYPRYKLLLETKITQLIQKSPKRLKMLAARVGARTYITGILLNSATLCGALALNNYLTYRKVQKDVAKLDQNEAFAATGYPEYTRYPAV